jgi:protein SCO1/2
MKHTIVYPLLLLSTVCISLVAWQSRSHSSPCRYELQGQVVSVNRQQRTVEIAHEEIQGYMSAMTMPFTLKAEDWAYGKLKPGDHIQAMLVVEGDQAWLEDVVFARGRGTEMLDVVTPQTVHVPAPGEEVPDFSLVNQDEHTIRLQQYRDKVLVLTFIYTRCPIARGCPQMVGIFAEMHQALRNNPALQAKTHLLCISFDPANDTPALLRDYGTYYTDATAPQPFAHLEFASGTEEEVKAIARFFGLRYLPTVEQIAHFPRTAVISPEGKVVKVYTDNSWTAADLLRDVQQALARREQDNL